jgi:xanthosine utilization system XapX-like protein
MDIFRSEKAPYILGLLITIIGWHISQIANEISKTQAVSYSVDVDRTTKDVAAHIRNVSRTKSLVDVTFALECEGAARCFEPLRPAPRGQETYGRIEAVPPNATSRQEVQDSPIRILAKNTVAAGGEFRIRGRLLDPNARVNLFFFPNPDESQRPLDIYLYKRDTIGGLFVENYLTILGLSLVLCVGFLIYSLYRGSAPAPRKKRG